MYSKAQTVRSTSQENLNIGLQIHVKYITETKSYQFSNLQLELILVLALYVVTPKFRTELQLRELWMQIIKMVNIMLNLQKTSHLEIRFLFSKLVQWI